jgi:hypothetical protein
MNYFIIKKAQSGLIGLVSYYNNRINHSQTVIGQEQQHVYLDFIIMGTKINKLFEFNLI